MLLFLTKLDPIAFNLGDLQIRWYAIFILSGAFGAYLLSRLSLKIGGYDPNIADDILVVALPAGILGARLWWCLCDGASPFYDSSVPWYKCFYIWEGGLAIQGGVLLGAAAGIALVLIKYKELPILFAMDAVIPNIFIGQVLGRWGNFFNQEVYGRAVPYEKLNFLPKFIQNQMRGDLVNGVVESEIYDKYINTIGDFHINYDISMAAQPLFLYESLLNLLGLILISFVLRLFWKKGKKQGDLSALYLIWYGIVRFVLEPLRNPEFQMNPNGNTSEVAEQATLAVSQITALLFIIGGILFMVALRVIPKLKEKKHD